MISHRLLAKHSPFSASRSLRQAVVGSAPNNESFAPCHQELATKIETLRTSTFPKSRLACRAEIPPGFARHDFCTLLLPDSCSAARKPGKGLVSGCCSQPQNNWPQLSGPLHRALARRQQVVVPVSTGVVSQVWGPAFRRQREPGGRPASLSCLLLVPSAAATEIATFLFPLTSISVWCSLVT